MLAIARLGGLRAGYLEAMATEVPVVATAAGGDGSPDGIFSVSVVMSATPMVAVSPGSAPITTAAMARAR